MISSFGAPLKLRQQRLGHVDGSPVTETIYPHVVSEDGKHYAAKLGKAVWGILDAIGRQKKNRELAWSLTPVTSVRKWLRGHDLNVRPSGYENVPK